MLSMSKFPDVQGGGSLLLAWQVKHQNVLVIGGGEVAAGRILNLLNADARVTVICPASGLNSEVRHRIQHDQVKYIDRNFEFSDLDESLCMVLCAIDDPVASSEVYRLCKERRISVNIADVPPKCDFYFGSTHRDGPLQIMVSTNGNGPKLANIIRRRVASNLPPNSGDAIAKIGQLRCKLRKQVPEIEAGPKRMQWMSRVCEKWSLDELCDMTDEDMDALLGFYEPGQVPRLEQIRLRVGESPGIYRFDGSFGWAI